MGATITLFGLLMAIYITFSLQVFEIPPSYIYCSICIRKGVNLKDIYLKTLYTDFYYICENREAAKYLAICALGYLSQVMADEK